MVTEENKYEIIERYLMGRLSLWELADIEAKIKSDSIFAEEVSFQRDLMIGINESKRLEIKKNLQQLKPAGILIKLQIDRDAIKTFAIAASILIIVTLGVFYPQIRDANIHSSKKSFSLSK